MITHFLLMLLLLFITLFIILKKNKLTPAAAAMAGVLACFIFAGTGFTGIAMIGSFFLLGTLATSWKINLKEGLGIAEREKGKRNMGQVIANGGVAGITGLLAFFLPQQQDIFHLMTAASLASATADTLSSELGTVYGKRFYNILSFKNDRRGENGVVSIEGFLIGIVGSTVIAIIYAAGFGWNYQIVLIVVAGTVGNIADSVLGATLERKKLLTNDAVNFLNTLIAAFFVVILFKLI